MVSTVLMLLVLLLPWLGVLGSFVLVALVSALLLAPTNATLALPWVIGLLVIPGIGLLSGLTLERGLQTRASFRVFSPLFATAVCAFLLQPKLVVLLLDQIEQLSLIASRYGIMPFLIGVLALAISSAFVFAGGALALMALVEGAVHWSLGREGSSVTAALAALRPIAVVALFALSLQVALSMWSAQLGKLQPITW